MAARRGGNAAQIAPRDSPPCRAARRRRARRRRRAEKPSLDWRGVRIPAQQRAAQDLPEVVRPTDNIAADEVWIVSLEIGRPRSCCEQAPHHGNPGAYRSTGRSSLSVMSNVDPLGTWRVSAHAARCCPCRRARRIEQARLGQQHERPFGVLACGGGILGGGDLVERAAQVHCRSTRARSVSPGNRPAQRPIDLERGSPESVLREPVAISCRERVACYCDELSGVGVEQYEARVAQLRRRRDPMIDNERPAQRLEIIRQCSRDRLCAANREGPAMRVSERAEDETEGRARGGVERQQ